MLSGPDAMTISPKPIDEVFVNATINALTHKDRVSLSVLLDEFKRKNKLTQTRLLYELSHVDDDDLFSTVSHLLSSVHEDPECKSMLLDFLLDRAQTNDLFILPYIDHAGLDRLREAIPVFASILINETDTHILQKTIYAVGLTGEKSCVNVIADFIFYDHEELKREAVKALGRIGGPSAIKRLAFAAKTSKTDELLETTLENLEAGLSLDDPSDMSRIEQFASKKHGPDHLSDDSECTQFIKLLTSSSPLDRLLAMDSLVETGSKAIPAIVGTMDDNDPDSLIYSFDIIGRIANETALPTVLKRLNTKHSDPNVRFSIYEALSRLPLHLSPLSLLDGITDPVEPVRLAAATAMDKNPSDIMIAGLKSKIETGGKRSMKSLITAAIIDSHSGTLFNKLLDSDAFAFLALDYLTHCHEHVVRFFSDLLIQRGLKSKAMTLSESMNDKRLENSLMVFCVDPSDIWRKFYIKVFHHAGHVPFVFENAEKALSMLKRKKPDLILTDFNITGVHGLHLVENIRNIYGKRELPIAVTTTRKDLLESNDSHQRLYEIRCLMDLVVQKPLELRFIKPLMDHRG